MTDSLYTCYQFKFSQPFYIVDNHNGRKIFHERVNTILDYFISTRRRKKSGVIVETKKYGTSFKENKKDRTEDICILQKRRLTKIFPLEKGRFVTPEKVKMNLTDLQEVMKTPGEGTRDLRLTPPSKDKLSETVDHIVRIDNLQKRP